MEKAKKKNVSVYLSDDLNHLTHLAARRAGISRHELAVRLAHAFAEGKIDIPPKTGKKKRGRE